MNILICDDMKNESDKLVRLLETSGFNVKTAVFNDGACALNYVRSNKRIDACFIDILMPEMSGIELTKKMRDEGFKGEIIFLSTSKEYGPESYRVKAFDYLQKPPTPDTVRDILIRLEDAMLKVDKDGLMVSSRSFTRFLPFREIEYSEVIQHKVYLQLTDGGNIELSVPFSEIAPQLLCDKRFAQCHRSYIVNMNAITTIMGREITMQGGVKIPISRGFYDMKRKYLDWGLEREN